MELKQMAAGKGVEWFKLGWSLFRAAPASWMLISLVFLLITAGSHLVPAVGSLILGIATPALIAGFLFGCHQLTLGHPLKVAHLFQPFDLGARTRPLLIFGIYLIAGTLILALLAALLLAGFLQSAEIQTTESGGAYLLIIGFIVLMILVCLGLAMVLFAIPDILFGNASVPGALKLSLHACRINFAPLSILSIIYTLLSIVAILPAGLGLLLILPMMTGSLYFSYSDIYGSVSDSFADDQTGDARET